MNITRVETILLSLPSPRQRVSLTDPKKPTPTSVVAVRVHTKGGHVGIGFTSSPVAGKAIASLIESELAPLVVGEDAR